MSPTSETTSGVKTGEGGRVLSSAPARGTSAEFHHAVGIVCLHRVCMLRPPGPRWFCVGMAVYAALEPLCIMKYVVPIFHIGMPPDVSIRYTKDLLEHHSFRHDMDAEF